MEAQGEAKKGSHRSKLSHCFCSQNYSRHREFSDFQPKILMTTMRSFIFKVKHITYTLNVNPVLKRVFHTVLYLGKAWLLSVIYKTMILNQPSRFPSDLHMVQHTVQHNQAPNFIHPVVRRFLPSITHVSFTWLVW